MRKKLKMIGIISSLCFLLLTTSLISAQLNSQDQDELVLLQTGFEQEWTLDNDNVFYAPVSGDDIWEIEGLTTNVDHGTSYWHNLRSDEGNSQYIHSGNAAAGVWPKGNGIGNDEWLITPTLDFSQYYDIQLSFWSQYHPTSIFLMPFYQEIRVNNTYLVKASIDNGKTWKTVADLRDDDAYQIGVNKNTHDYWNEYDEIIEIPFRGLISGEKQVKIAWHYQYSGNGPAGHWTLDDISITGKKDTEKPVIELIKPEKDGLYFNDNFIKDHHQTVLIGDITIIADPTDNGVGTDTVSFYLDGKLKHRDSSYPYEWEWIMPGFGEKTLHITASDKNGNENSVDLTVFKLF